MDSLKFTFYQRKDGKWSWRIKHPNGNTLATDGNQGYANFNDCTMSFWNMIEMIKGGNYSRTILGTTPLVAVKPDSNGEPDKEQTQDDDPAA